MDAKFSTRVNPMVAQGEKMEKAKFFRAGAEVSEEEFFRSGKEQKMLRQKKLVAMYGELMDGVYNKFVQERCGCGSIEITILY